MAKVTIGGVEYALPELVLAKIDQLAPLIDELPLRQKEYEAAPTFTNIMAVTSVSVAMVSVWLEGSTPDDVSVEGLKARMKGSEINDLQTAITEGLSESGLIPKGEPAGVAQGSVAPARTRARSANRSRT